jgi:catechol 2,3-dioxygenase-like lactoylglutathione lyase family enzyme
MVKSASRKSATSAMSDAAAVATIAVTDLKQARRFYERTLGFEHVDTQGEEAVTYSSGGSHFFVYRSQFAGSNEATAATWMVEDVEGLVADLKDRGVEFEHYDMPGMTRRGDVHVAGEMKAAWFKDPDGNILALVSEA